VRRSSGNVSIKPIYAIERDRPLLRIDRLNSKLGTGPIDESDKLRMPQSDDPRPGLGNAFRRGVKLVIMTAEIGDRTNSKSVANETKVKKDVGI
jgi:hypothetical protein